MMDRRVRACFAVVMVVIGSVTVRQPVRAAGARTDANRLLGMETNPAVVNVLYRYGQNVSAANGAYGPNVTAPRSAWFLEYQRAGALDIIDGVVRPDQDPSLVRMGLSMFRFGLARQARDGLFPGSSLPFHGTAMFLSEAAPALIVLNASALGPAFAPEVRWQVARMQRAAYAIVRSVGGPGKLDDYTKNHRWFEAAIALAAVGILAGDATLERWSRVYAWRGIRMARPNGVMPEDGGHDTGYQGLGMINASRYLELEATGRLRTALQTTLGRGEAWLLSRVRPDGMVDQRGDTRSVGCQERDPVGKCKTVMYAPIYSALARWAVISGDARYSAAARRVWYRAGYWNRR